MRRIIQFRDWSGEKIEKSKFPSDERDEPLVDFFNNQAEVLVKGHVSTVKCAYEGSSLLGYYAVAMSQVKPTDIFDEKRVATYAHPSLILGRLLLRKDYRGQKIGKAMLDSVILLAQSIGKFTACRFVSVDSKPWVVDFYRAGGFMVVGGNETIDKQIKRRGTVSMLFDLYPPQTYHGATTGS